MLATLLPGALDQRGDVIQFLLREFGVGHVEQGGDGATGRAVKEGANESTQGQRACSVAWHDGREDVARPVHGVCEVPFFFKNAEQRSYGRIRRCVGERGLHLRGRGRAAGVDDIHDLSFSATEGRASSVGHAPPTGQQNAKFVAGC